MTRTVSSWLARACACLSLLLVLCGAAPAQDALPPDDAGRDVSGQPAQVRQFLDLLADPSVQEWLRRAQAQELAPPVEPLPDDNVRRSASAGLAERLDRARGHIRDIVAALPDLPARIAEAGARLVQAVRGDERTRGGELTLVVFGLGALAAFATRRVGQGATREWQQASAEPVKRLQRFGLRLAIATLPAAAFTIGALLGFVLFEWPLALKHITVAYALAVVAILLAWNLFRVLLGKPAPHRDATGEPAAPDMTDHASAELARATFWHRRLVLLSGYFVLAWATVETLRTLDLPLVSRQASAYLLGLGLLAIALETIWRRPPAGEETAVRRHIGARASSVLLTLAGGLLWWLWAAGFNGMFWLLMFALVLPPTISAVDVRVKRLLRPEDGTHAGHASVLEVCISRGARLALIVGAVWWLAHIWHIDLIALTEQGTPLKRLARGVLNAVITLFFAEFMWQVIKAAIDARLAQAGPAQADGEDGHIGISHAAGNPAGDPVRLARLRTLLPIFRNILLVVIAAIAILMALSALGVEIGPLIAGAGVVGVAVGFGSQTLVKDVISGVFYLLDDAFRIGEYIQSGSYKGVVESFSLRSVKLRHHRGPVYTVPFGQLGAVQNMSRDWVVDKFGFNVAFDTDLDKARKIIKSIGQELADDPEHAPHVLQPLKMQGVEQFGEYGMQIRCKMMTRPGQQFVLRRTALRRIKEAFDQAGIRFALPRVHVAGSGDTAAAAAEQIRDHIAKAAREAGA